MAKIEKAKSGNYRARVYLGEDAAGKKHWKSITHPDAKRLKRLVSEYEDTHRDYSPRCTVDAAIIRYQTAKKAVISPSTLLAYNSYHKTLKREFGAFLRLSAHDLTRASYQELINSLVKDGKSAKYIRNIKGLIDSSLRFSDCVPPVVQLPARSKPVLCDPTREQIAALLDAVSGTGIEIAVRLGIHGLRRSEICGLELSDVSPEWIHVHRSRIKGTNGYTTKETPKNDASDRFVPISAELYDLIQKQGYIVKIEPDSIQKAFKRALIRAELPTNLRFHDLRHFFASYMHEQGFTDAQIQSMGGWKTDNMMKRVYRYALADSKSGKRAAELLNQI